MAVRFSANGQRRTASFTGGSQSAYSMTGWFKLMADRNTDTVLLGLSNSGDTDYMYLITNTSGTQMLLFSDFAERSLGSLSVGTWTYIGAALSGNNYTVRWRTLGAPSFTSYSGTINNASLGSFQRIVVGDWLGGGGFWFNGSVAAIKIYTAALSAAELEAEYTQLQPVRTADLFAYYRFENTSNANTDSSGNGRNLSGSGGSNDTDPDGIPEVAGPKMIVHGWGPVAIR